MLGLLVWSCQRGTTTEPGAPSPMSAAVPTRVVSLIPSATELIYEVGAGETLVGVTVNDRFPPAVEKLPRVGDQTIDFERLVSLQPDLVVLDSEFNKDAARLEQLRLPVLALRSRRLADVADNLERLGSRLGREDEGRAAARRLREALSQTPKLGVKETVLVEIWGSPLMTVGADSLPDDLLRQLGLSNAYADQKGFFQVSPEDVVSRRPGIIILPTDGSREKSAAAELLHKAGIPVKVIVIDGHLFTNPTPRVLEGLDFIAQELSPGWSGQRPSPSVDDEPGEAPRP